MSNVKGVGARLRADADKLSTERDRIDCSVCGNGRRGPGTTTVTLTRDDKTIVFRHVPAEVCDNCGDDRIDVDVARRLEQLAKATFATGTRYDVVEYKAA